MATTIPNVSVDATWRMTRFEFNTPPQVEAGMVYGYSEVMLQEPAKPTKGAEFMNVRAPLPQQQDETGKKTYGSMPGAMINRSIGLVKDEKVQIAGTAITFAELLEACNAFFEKWRVEDESVPAPTMMPPAPPPDNQA